MRLAALFLTACQTVTSSTMSPATAKLACLDCDQPVAIGVPLRVVSSWVGSCTTEGYTAFFEDDKERHSIVWKRTPFATTKACDEHHYKIVVRCSTTCVIRAMDSPDTSTVKLLGIHPQHPGKFKFAVELRRSKEGEVVASYASDELVVRAPDEVSRFETERPIDDPSPLAVFSGFEYFLEPGSARANKPPDRGTKYVPTKLDEDEHPPQPDRLERSCKARTPGAIAWRPCTQGIQAGDDVRIDVTAWYGTTRLADVALTEGDLAWTCYRATFVPGAQICVRYGVPAGEHTLTWKGLGYTFEDKLVVGGAP